MGFFVKRMGSYGCTKIVAGDCIFDNWRSEVTSVDILWGRNTAVLLIAVEMVTCSVDIM